MKKFFWLLVLLAGIGFYLHKVQGWDWERARSLPGVSFVLRETDSATTAPIGQRGTGTHWETASRMPSARADFGAALVGDRIYVVGGRDGYLRTLSSVLVYDILTDTWSEAAPLPQALHHVAVTTDGKKVYVLGGLSGLAERPVDEAYAYDPLRNAWEELGQLNDFRGDAAAAYLKDSVVILGGVTAAGTDDAFERYDFEQKNWNGVKTMPTARRAFAAVVHEGALFALGGRTGATKETAAVERFVETEDWKGLQEMPSQRYAFAAAVQQGSVLAIGGKNDDGLIATIDALDLKKNAWTTFPLALPHPRHGLAAVAYKNRVYLLGGGMAKGYSVSDLNEVLVFE